MKDIEKLNYRPFTRFCMSIGAVPSSYLAGLDIEEQLLWLCSYLEKQVIPAVNNNGEAVDELQNLFTELQTYVNNYFDNLDVQEEINNKLDDMADSGELEEIIGSYLNTKALLCFDSVSDMVESENLIDGSYAKTLGFYNKNDRGSSLYKIREENNDDIESNVLLKLENGLVAEFIKTNNLINVAQFGIKEDDSTDETELLQKLINYAKENNLKVIGNKNPIKLTDTIDIPYAVDIEKIHFKFYESNNYINNYCIYINANSTHNGWQIAYPSSLKGSLNNCFFENATDNGYNCIYNYSNQIFDRNEFKKFNISFRTDTSYLDSWQFTNNNISERYTEGTDYAVYCGFLGDQVVFDNFHYFGTHGTNVLYIGSGHNGIIFNNIICHGNIKLYGSNVTFNNLHCEDKSAVIDVEQSIAKFSNCFLYHNTTANEHNFEISGRSSVILENVKFMIYPKLDDNSTDDIDVNITNGNVNINNCYKIVDDNNNISSNFMNAIKTNKDLSLASSYEVVNANDRISHLNNDQVSVNKSINSVTTNTNSTWKLPSGTYYYKCIPFIDFTRHLTNQSYYTTYNISLTNGEGGFFINAPTPGFWRIYRGTSENTFDSYVDVCVFKGGMFDNGYFINGYKWISRTPGASDSMYLLAANTSVGYMGEMCTVTGGYGAPTQGTWKQGDIIYNKDYSGSNTRGWICTADGSPGTWKSF